MSNLHNLIKSSKQKRELTAVTVRMTPELLSFTEELAEYLGLSRQETLIHLIQEGVDSAEEALNGQESETLDIDESNETKGNKVSSFYLLNTNKSHSLDDHQNMLKNGTAAAFYGDWKKKIKSIKQGDIVFLYGNGEGIVAYGTGTGETIKCAHNNQPDECFYQKLDNFKQLNKPITAAEIKKILGQNLPFLQTMRRIPEGQKIMEAITKLHA